MQVPAAVSPRRRVLMGPGPSDVDDAVLSAMARPTLGHLDPDFLGIMDEIRAMLRAVFRTENELTMPMSGTGSAGMETCMANLLEPGDRALVGVNGVFGTRMAEVARRCGAEVVECKGEWGRAFTADQLRAAAGDGRFDLVAVVHAETSTGVLQPIPEIRALADDLGALLLIDCVTSLAGHAVEIDGWGVDAAYSGTQKCLSCPPGLSPVTFSARAVEKMLQAVVMPCRWHENGCNETGTSAARTKHEEACTFKRYTCPAKGCTHTCGADEMVDHIVNAHLEAQRAGGDIQDVDKRFTKGLRSKKPWETPEFENGVFAIVARRKNRSLFQITLQMAPGRILLKARAPFDLDRHKYVRVGLSVKENATGVSVPLPLEQTDEWETRRNSLDANDPSVFSFPASMFAHTERSAEDVAAERLRYSVSFEFES